MDRYALKGDWQRVATSIWHAALPHSDASHDMMNMYATLGHREYAIGNYLTADKPPVSTLGAWRVGIARNIISTHARSRGIPLRIKGVSISDPSRSPNTTTQCPAKRIHFTFRQPIETFEDMSATSWSSGSPTSTMRHGSGPPMMIKKPLTSR